MLQEKELLEVNIKINGVMQKPRSFKQENIVLGRSKHSSYKINSDHISRFHLKVVLKNKEIYIANVSKTNWVMYKEENLAKGIDTLYTKGSAIKLPDGVVIRIANKIKPKPEPTRAVEQLTNIRIKIPFGIQKYTKAIEEEKEKEKEKEKEAMNPEIRSPDSDFHESEPLHPPGTISLLRVLSVLVFTTICLFITRQYIKSNQTPPANTVLTAEMPIQITKVKAPVRKKLIKVELSSSFTEHLEVKKKCRYSKIRKLCKLLFSRKSRHEGAYLNGDEFVATIHINKQRRAYNFNSETTGVKKLLPEEFAHYYILKKLSTEYFFEQLSSLEAKSYTFYFYNIIDSDYSQITEVKLTMEQIESILSSHFRQEITKSEKTGSVIDINSFY